MTLNLRLVFCSHFLEVFLGRFLLDIQHKNFELSVCVAWTVRVTEIFLYTKVYSFGGNKALLRVKRTFELSEFELSRFYCTLYRASMVLESHLDLPSPDWPCPGLGLRPLLYLKST